MYDIAIIGLGPAGSTLARLLDRQFSVLALDKKIATDRTKPPAKHFSSPPKKPPAFNKPCGGLLAPDAQNALARFGLTLPKEVLADPQIFSVRTIDLASNLELNYPRSYLNMDRHAFDTWLISLIPPHVKVKMGVRVISIKPISTTSAFSPGPSKLGYLVTWEQNGQRHTAQAKVIIGADGANSLVRKICYQNSPCRSYTAIQQWFKDDHKTPQYSCLFDQELSDCYAWGISKNGYFIFGGAFAPQDARKKFEQLKKKAAKYDFILERPLYTEACMVRRPESPLSIYTGSDNVFLVGEAAGFISPSSLEGISYAFDSAKILSKILNNNCQNPNLCYNLRTLPLRAKIGLKLLKAPFMYKPFLRKLVMKSGIGSIFSPHHNDLYTVQSDNHH